MGVDGRQGGAGGGALLIRRAMTVFLGVGSLVLFAAVLVLALGGRPESGRRNDSSRGTGGREGPINLVRGKDFFERSKDT